MANDSERQPTRRRGRVGGRGDGFARGGRTVVRVAHVIAQGNRGGIDFRNLGTMFDGRILHGIAEGNVLRENTAGGGHGIRVTNIAGVTGATLWVTLRDNHSSGNLDRLVAENFNSSGNRILIESSANDFSHNRRGGCGLTAGGSNSGVADSNVLVFEAHHDVIADNDGDGIHASWAGSARALENQTSGNVLQVSLVDTKFSGNHPGSDINAFGALGTGGILPGRNNHVEMLLQRVSPTLPSPSPTAIRLILTARTPSWFVVTEDTNAFLDRYARSLLTNEAAHRRRSRGFLAVPKTSDCPR